MSGAHIDELLDIWASTLEPDSEKQAPFANHNELYETIDSTKLGDVAWQSFSVVYHGAIPDNPPPWMTAEYVVWFRDPKTVLKNQLANPDFEGEIDYAPKQVFGDKGKREYQDLMSGNWAWNQAVCSLYSFD